MQRALPSLAAFVLLAAPAAAGGPPESAKAEAGAVFDNGRLASGRVLLPRYGLEIRAGDLGAGAGAPLIGDSPYLTLKKSYSTDGKYLSWGYEAQASALDLRARHFAGTPPPDPLLRDGSQPDSWSRDQLYFFSGLAHVGRAWNLWGPVDFGVGVLASGRTVERLVNGALDEAVGLRVRLGGGHEAGAFAGVTQAVSVLDEDWGSAVLRRESAVRPRLRAVPHGELVLSGPLPWRQAAYEAWASVQRNPFTDLMRAEGLVAVPVAAVKGVVTVGLRAEREVATTIDFTRRESSARVALERRGWTASLAAGRQEIGFGGIGFSGKFVSIGLQFLDPLGGIPLRLETRASQGELSQQAPAWAAEAQRAVSDGVVVLDALLSRAAELARVTDAAAIETALRELHEALPPELKAALEAELGGPVDFAGLAQALQARGPDVAAALTEARGQLARVQEALSQPDRLERVLTRFVRVSLYEAIGRGQLKLWGERTPVSPGLLLALIHTYGSGATPVPPLDPRTLGPVLNDYVAERLRRRFGIACPGGDLVGCALERLPPEQRALVDGLPADQARRFLAEAVSLLADTIRLETNRYLLSLYLSARRFDALTVEGGRTPGEINVAKLRGYFRRLDPPSATRPIQQALELGARRHEAEAQEALAELERKDREAGATLASDLRAAGFAAAPEEVARLAREYGSQNLRAFAAAAGARLAARGLSRLTLRYSDDPVLGRGLSHGRGEAELRLGAPGGREPAAVLAELLFAL